jgi:hypothetical protein
LMLSSIVSVERDMPSGSKMRFWCRSIAHSLSID